MPRDATAYADLGMYPFESVAWAWDRLWQSVHSQASWAPAALTWSGDVHASWDDSRCVVTQMCGGPLVETYQGDFGVVGAFSLDIAEADQNGATYRTVLMSTTDTPVEARDFAGTHVAANGADSLSGWHSLRAATVGVGVPWPGAVTYTGAHRESLVLLATGAAELASIDPWSLAIIEREQPDLIAGLHRVGSGPTIPTPPITVRRGVSESATIALQEAFMLACDDPELADVRSALCISSFEPVDLRRYLALAKLVANA